MIYGREFEFLGSKKRDRVLQSLTEDNQDEEEHQLAPSQDVAASIPSSPEPLVF